MTMTLMLMRHGDDNGDGLSYLGKRQVAAVADDMLRLSYRPDVLLHSSLARAKESADIVRGVFRKAGRVITDVRSSDAISCGNILPEVSALMMCDETVLVIGHMPGISATVWELAKFDYAPGNADTLVITCGIDRWSELPRIDRTHSSHLKVLEP